MSSRCGVVDRGVGASLLYRVLTDAQWGESPHVSRFRGGTLRCSGGFLVSVPPCGTVSRSRYHKTGVFHLRAWQVVCDMPNLGKVKTIVGSHAAVKAL